MAGSYPDAPFRRMAWDEDGSILWSAPSLQATYTSVVTTQIVEYSVARKQKFNNEDEIGNDSVNVGSFVAAQPFQAFQIIFPEIRDLYGIAYWCNATLAQADDIRNRRMPNHVEVSANTPNGVTGAWVSIFPGDWEDATYPCHAPHDIYTWNYWYRIGIVNDAPLPVFGIRSIRWMQAPGENLIGSASWHHIHLYGDKSTGVTPDRLLFIDMDTGLEFQAPLDWGDVPQGTTLYHKIRMFNNSTTFTANDVILDFEALTGESDTWHSLRRVDDFINNNHEGGAYAARYEIASMPPLTYYPTLSTDALFIRLIVADNEDVGPNASRLQAETTAWT